MNVLTMLGNEVGDETKKRNRERLFVVVYRVIKVGGNGGHDNVICKRFAVLDIEGLKFF